MLSNNNWQKSPSRRFLLILGSVLFVCVFAWGLLIIFDDSFFASLAKTQKRWFGALICIYAVVRFQRIVFKKRDEI